MELEHWQKVKELFEAARENAPAERASFLDEVCGDDEETRREVESVKDDSSFELFRDDPRFQDLMRRVGFPQ